jgi:hypothetical protein
MPFGVLIAFLYLERWLDTCSKSFDGYRHDGFSEPLLSSTEGGRGILETLCSGHMYLLSAYFKFTGCQGLCFSILIVAYERWITFESGCLTVVTKYVILQEYTLRISRHTVCKHSGRSLGPSTCLCDCTTWRVRITKIGSC